MITPQTSHAINFVSSHLEQLGVSFNEIVCDELDYRDFKVYTSDPEGLRKEVNASSALFLAFEGIAPVGGLDGTVLLVRKAGRS